MEIDSIYLNNFKLFSQLDIQPGKVNMFRGYSFDNDSGNGSGKTTVALDSIIFALYGKAQCSLKDLVKKGEKKTVVKVDVRKEKDTYRIVRTYPSSLTIFKTGIELEFSTLSQAQDFIEKTFCNYETFRKFRTLDSSRGINILDLGITSLKGTLISFLEEEYSEIKSRLQERKRDRERFHKKHKTMPFFYSKRRQLVLEQGIKEAKNKINVFNNNQSKFIKQSSDLKSQIYYSSREVSRLEQEINNLLKPKTFCPTCKQEIKVENKEGILNKNKEEIKKLKEKKKELLKNNEEVNSKINTDERKRLEDRYLKLNNLLNKVTASKSLSQFRYTDRDIYVYSQCIKELEIFYLDYLSKWLNGLSTIINSVLSAINMEVTFINDKQFIKIKDGSEEMVYDQLSSGQKTFLNIIFKLSILLYQGSSGVVIIDEGVDSLSPSNISRLLYVFNSLPFQIFLISQHENIEGEVEVFNFTRKNNHSTIGE